MSRGGRGRGALLLLVSAAGGADAQAAPVTARFRYTAAQLDRATFAEHSTARLDGQTGTRVRRETITREGLWRMRAIPATNGLAIEAWYDSLALVRETAQGTLAPDTDGLLGGRYRGTLSPTGAYTPRARPFIPDQVAEVAELSRAMEDLLPPLPAVPLAAGQRWTDSSGLELRRLADSSASGRTILRLELRSRTESSQADLRGDTLALPASQTTVEEGRLAWDPARGLLRRERHIIVETNVPAGGPLKEPLRSRLEQTVVVERGR
ncbi:MAG TPA: hypothetical protein VF046_16380 [Gemmatimonadales bacterium]